MMGASPYMSRDDLLKYKKYKIEPEISFYQQRIFDKGHELEHLARPIAEQNIGEELYPITATVDIEKLPLLASFDGMTMLQDQAIEHKQWNDTKASFIENNDDLQPEYYWQLEQQLLVSDLDSILFVMSDGTEDKWLQYQYASKPERRQQLIAGWQQFKLDLIDYEYQSYPEKPTPNPVVDLPTLSYTMKGLSVSSNLSVYKIAAEQLVADAKQPMTSDQDFADREQLVKKFKDAEQKIKRVQAQIIDEITDISKFHKDLDYIHSMIREARLSSDKAIKVQKDNIRFEIANKAAVAFADFCTSLDLPKGIEITVTTHFNTVMKNKRTIQSLHEAVNNELARAKIAARQQVEKINKRYQYYESIAADHKPLFPDLNTLIHDEMFIDTLHQRINEQKLMEQQKSFEAKNEVEIEDEPMVKNLSPIEAWALKYAIDDEAVKALVCVLKKNYDIHINSAQ